MLRALEYIQFVCSGTIKGCMSRDAPSITSQKKNILKLKSCTVDLALDVVT